MLRYKCPNHGLVKEIKALITVPITMFLSTDGEFMGKYYFEWGYIRIEDLLHPVCRECNTELILVTVDCQHEITKDIIRSYDSDDDNTIAVIRMCTLCGVTVHTFSADSDEVSEYIVNSGNTCLGPDDDR